MADNKPNQIYVAPHVVRKLRRIPGKQVISVRLSGEFVVWLDEQRGGKSRTDMLRELLEPMARGGGKNA